MCVEIKMHTFEVIDIKLITGIRVINNNRIAYEESYKYTQK